MALDGIMNSGEGFNMTVSDRATSKKQQAIEDLRQRILSQQLPPGSYLDETALADAYQISRPPLREILRQLAGEGYVVLTENRGAQVAPMTHLTLRSFFSAAPMIYAAIARLAAEHATPEQIARLKETQAQFQGAIKGGDTVARALLNERFHALMGEMADNEYLTPSLRRLLIDHTRIGMNFYNPRNRAFAAGREIAVDQHERLIELIEAGDGNGASELAIAHWELSRTAFESFVVPPGMKFPLGQAPGTSNERDAA